MTKQDVEADNATYLRKWTTDIRERNGKSVDADKLDSIAAKIDDLKRALSSSRGEQGWRTIDSAPKDGTHIIGNTQWGAREIWWHKDAYEGEYWTDEGDSEPEPTGWIPKPGDAPSAPGSVTTSLAGQGTDDPTDINKLARNIADFWFDSRGQQGGVHHSRAELTEVIAHALRAAAPQPTARVPPSLAGQVPDDLVEACARALHRIGIAKYGVTPDWDKVVPTLQANYRDEARAVIACTNAAPQPTAGGDA